MTENNQAVVIDNGSGRIKVGFAGNDVPTTAFSTFVGRMDPTRIRYRLLTSSNVREKFVGPEAQKLRGILSLQYPIERGVVTDWQSMEDIWSHVFENSLKTRPVDQPVLITMTPFAPKKQQVQICESMFETFGVPAVNIASTGLLAMAAFARKNGVIVDCGDSVSYVMPVVDGRASPESLMVAHYAGRELTIRMAKLVATGTGVSLADSSAKREIARDVKQKLCFVSTNFVDDLRRARASRLPAASNQYDRTYVMPDGHPVTIGEERFLCPEALFQPSLAGRDGVGLQDMVCDAIQRASGSSQILHRFLFSNIVLCGGTTAFEGFAQRLASELQKRVSRSVKIKVTAPPERHYLSWSGGSKVAKSETCQWLTKAYYEEHGPLSPLRKFVLP